MSILVQKVPSEIQEIQKKPQRKFLIFSQFSRVQNDKRPKTNENTISVLPYFNGERKGDGIKWVICFQRGVLMMKPMYKLSWIGRVSRQLRLLIHQHIISIHRSGMEYIAYCILLGIFMYNSHHICIFNFLFSVYLTE